MALVSCILCTPESALPRIKFEMSLPSHSSIYCIGVGHSSPGVVLGVWSDVVLGVWSGVVLGVWCGIVCSKCTSPVPRYSHVTIM